MSSRVVFAALLISFAVVAVGVSVVTSPESVLEDQTRAFVVTDAFGQQMDPIPFGTLFEGSGVNKGTPFCLRAWLGIKMQLWEKKACQFTGSAKPDVEAKAHGMVYRVHYYGCEFLNLRLEVHKANSSRPAARIQSWKTCERIYELDVPTCATTNSTMCKVPGKTESPHFETDLCMPGECDEEHCCTVKTCAMANANICNGTKALQNITNFASNPCIECGVEECCSAAEADEGLCRAEHSPVQAASYAIFGALFAVAFCCGAGFVLLLGRSE